MAEETKIKEDTVTVPVAQGDLDAVSNAEFYNPHGVLGGHLGIGKHADTATIRVLRPLAKSVTILTRWRIPDDPRIQRRVRGYRAGFRH